MSEFKPTQAQQRAIETRNGTVLVSAGAGSGKTKVLTERLMSRIKDTEHPVDVDSFLVITFTNAAAGELKGRIMDELAAALAKDPQNKRLRRQSALCRKAQISTIHGFCSGILRENSQLAGITPDFKIMESDRASAMKASALDRVLDRHYEQIEKQPGFRLLADTVGAGRDDRGLSDAVLKLNEQMQSHARPEKWAEEQIELLHTPFFSVEETPWGREILSGAKESVKFWKKCFEELVILMDGDEKLLSSCGASFSQACDIMRDFLAAAEKGWDSARNALPIKFPNYKSPRFSKNTEQSIKDEYKNRSDTFKTRWEKCKKQLDGLNKSIRADSETLLGEMQQCAPAMEALLNLSLELDREFGEDKRRQGLVDYNDLEHMTARLLTDENGEPTDLARQISRRYTEIMVDEYQDVSRVQDAIFRAVSKDEKNLFLVGDVKQSIYRFRLAEPEIFTEKYLRFKDDAAAPEGEERRIMLRENFRSRKEVLSGVNTVFSLCMSRALGDIDYDENAALKFGGGYDGDFKKPEIMLLNLPAKGEDDEASDKKAMEAVMIGRKIKQLMSEGATVTERGEERPLEFRDIAILLRSDSRNAPIYRRELMAMGIPVAAGQGTGFFTSVEVSTLLSMLAVIDNPHQDIPLIAVLSSPAFGFTGDQLAAIRACDKKGEMYSALLRRAQEDEKCRRFAETLSEFREIAADIPASELLWRLIDRLNILPICSAMSDGALRRARVMELQRLSEGYESSGFKGLHRFVLWLKEKSEQEAEPVVSVGGSENAVRIMSMHKSKGLEFPVVFAANLGSKFNTEDLKNKILIHPVLGLGPKVTELNRRLEYPGLSRMAISRRLLRENLSEELRVLYVALTRAKEYLFMCAAVKDAEKELEQAEGYASLPLGPEILALETSPIYWILYAALADRQKNITVKIYAPESGESQGEQEDFNVEADADAINELKRRLAFSYPYDSVVELPSKLTATELKGRAQTEAEQQESIVPRRRISFPLPDFAKKDKPLTGTERGTATHLMLQYMDFGKTGSEQEIAAELERLEKAQFLSPREAEAVDIKAVSRLFSSPLGQKMKNADCVKREFKFSLLWDGDLLYSGAEGEKLLMQGVVDCYIEQEGSITIIDYKTDHVFTEQAIAERAEFYRGQMEVYAKSLSRICGKPVKSCVLYFLSAGKEVSLNF